MAFDTEQVVYESAILLARNEIRWGTKTRPDGTVREGGNMLILHFMPQGGFPKECTIPDDLVIQALELKPMTTFTLEADVTGRAQGVLSRSATGIHSKAAAPVVKTAA